MRLSEDSAVRATRHHRRHSTIFTENVSHGEVVEGHAEARNKDHSDGSKLGLRNSNDAHNGVLASAGVPLLPLTSEEDSGPNGEHGDDGLVGLHTVALGLEVQEHGKE